MSSFIANTKVRIATGVTKDDHDDPIEAPFPEVDEDHPAVWFPASIIEKTKQVFDPTTGTRRTVRYAVGRVKPTVPLHDGDRLLTVRGKTYVVDEMTGGDKTVAGFTDVTLDLRITSGE